MNKNKLKKYNLLKSHCTIWFFLEIKQIYNLWTFKNTLVERNTFDPKNKGFGFKIERKFQRVFISKFLKTTE